MSPLDVSRAVDMARADEFDAWLQAHGATETEIIVAIYKKASGKQTVDFTQLQEAALCNGWVDTQTKGIDDERYAIRFAPRRPRSNWSETNRAMARRLIADGRMREAGAARLPPDL
jgi:uncharacterized protein YdeI (YjbR/CyaY-like superfamily)